MNYFADLDPFSIRVHNEEVLKEVRKLRLGNRQRDRRQWRSGRTFAFNLKGMLLPR